MQGNLKAAPLSRDDIKRIANQIRERLQITTPYFPIDIVLEFIHLLAPGYTYEILDEVTMGNNHGLTHYNDKVIQIREDVYDRACSGEGRDRMTIAHEIGHAILHNESLMSARDFSSSMKPYEDPEWQAKAFAGHLLIPDSVIHLHSAQDLTLICGVSFDAASYLIKVSR